MDKQQFKNLLAFLFLMSNGETLISKSPDYIIEKAHRYIDCKAVKSSVEVLWGLHPTLKEYYDFYCSHWEVQINSLDKK